MKTLDKETPKIIMWQEKLLPVMTSMLIVLTLFFFAASFIQLYYLHGRIEKTPNLDLKPALSMRENDGSYTNESDEIELIRWKTLSMLEANALARRYHQANVSLMSRIWTRYLGFVTGMILALVGAAFILGKLREPKANLAVEGAALGKFHIASASPGLILAFLGTILMVTTMVTHNEIEVKDSSLYTSEWFNTTFTGTGIEKTPLPEPLGLPSEEEILGNMKKKLGMKEPE